MADQYEPEGVDPRREDREVYFEDVGAVDAGVHWRPALPVGETVAGPAILEGTGSTAIVPPDATARVVEDGSVLIERGTWGM
jgi:N-methylhydantoinase A